MGLFDGFKKDRLVKKVYRLIDQGKYQEAIECFDKVLELNPTDSNAWNRKGLILAGSKIKKHHEAVECFNKSLELDSKNVEAWCNKGATLALIKKNREASTCFEKALELNPDFEPAKEFLKIMNWLNAVSLSKKNRKPEHKEKENKYIQSKLL